jgi:hypothetical protein
MEEELTNQKEMIEQQRSEVLRLQDEYEKSRSPEPGEVESLRKQEESLSSDNDGEEGATAQGEFHLGFIWIYSPLPLSRTREQISNKSFLSVF